MSNVVVSKKVAVINSASGLMTMLLQLSVMVWVHQHLLRRISPEEYSLLPLLTSLIVIFPVFAVLLTSGIARYVTEAAARDDEDSVVKIVSSVFPLLVGMAVLVCLAGLVMMVFLGNIVRISPERLNEARLMFGLLLVRFAVTLPTAPLSVGFFVRQRFCLSNVIDLLAECLRIGLLLALLTFCGSRALWVVVASSSVQVLAVIVRMVVSLRLLPILRLDRSKFCWRTAREIASFGGWISLAQIGGLIYSAADPILLSWFASPVDIATFSVGALPHRHLQPLVMTVSAPLSPAFVAMHARGHSESLNRAFCRLGRYVVWFIGMFAVALLLFRHEFFQLYLAEKWSLYRDTGTVAALLLSPLILSYSVASGLDKAAIATGRIRTYVCISIGSQLLNLCLTLFFLGVCGFGAIGSAMATFVTGLVAFPFYLALALRLLGLPLHEYVSRVLVPGSKPILLTAAIGLVLRSWFVPVTWMSLAVGVLGCVLIYILSVYCVARWGEDRADMAALKKYLVDRVAALRNARKG